MFLPDCSTEKCELEHELAQKSKGKQCESVSLDVVETSVEVVKAAWKRKYKKKKQPKRKQRKSKGRQHGRSANDCGGCKSKQASENSQSSTNRGIPGNHARGANYRQQGRSGAQGNDSDSDDDHRRKEKKLPKGQYVGLQWETDDHMSVDKSIDSQSPKEASATAVLVAQEERVTEVCHLLDVSV